MPVDRDKALRREFAGNVVRGLKRLADVRVGLYAPGSGMRQFG